MTNNQLTYWANIERERYDKAMEALESQRIAAQRYAAQLNYAASLNNAKLNYAAQMQNIANQRYLQEQQLNFSYDQMWFNKYGVTGIYGRKLNDDIVSNAEDIQHRLWDYTFPSIAQRLAEGLASWTSKKSSGSEGRVVSDIYRAEGSW